jgi:hypothetical protein
MVRVSGDPPEISLRTIRSFKELLPNEIQGPGSTGKGMARLVRNRIGVPCLDSGISSVIESPHMNRKVLGELVEDRDGNKHDGHCDDERDCFSEI